jgi:hypothetical protein
VDEGDGGADARAPAFVSTAPRAVVLDQEVRLELDRVPRVRAGPLDLAFAGLGNQ